jgi:hypothetical protein
MYAQWIARDQSVLDYLLTSLTREVLTGVATMNSLAEVWHTLASMYASHSVQTRLALATARKGAQCGRILLQDVWPCRRAGHDWSSPW